MKILVTIFIALTISGCGWLDKYKPKTDISKKEETPALEQSTPAKPSTTFIDFKWIEAFYNSYNARMPRYDTVSVCSAHGCQHQQRYRLKSELLQELSLIMKQATDGPSEREALKKAIARIETVVGQATGTDKDKAWLSFRGNSDPGQLDCTDEAINITGYLIVMHRNGLIHHHAIHVPKSRFSLTIANHYGATIVDVKTLETWIIDGNVGDNGEEPAILEESVWKGNSWPSFKIKLPWSKE